jgi:hypothetical protein
MTLSARTARNAFMVAGTMLASSALAQFDNSPWPGFSGGANKHRSVNAPGPVTADAQAFIGVGVPSYGGITLGSDGAVYYKEYWTNANGDGTGNVTIVKRMNPDTGAIEAETANLGGVGGDHGGVAVGVDALYVPIFRGFGNPTSIFKLNKTTLAVIAEFTNPLWISFRGTPLIGNVPNMNGNRNIYVTDRAGATGNQIVAIDSVTGAHMGAFPLPAQPVLGQLGPMWTDNGRDAFAFFNNADLGNAFALRDNGDGTLTNLWGVFAGPGNFNWWGSGALSDDGTRIYVTTFNDNFTASLWALNVSDGTQIWSVDGRRGEPDELNFFGRPAVIGNSIYCGGGAAVIAKFTDLGSSVNRDWVRWGPGGGTKPPSGPEMTTTSAVRTPEGQVYVYSIAQDEGGLGRLDVLHDEGSTFTEVFRTNLDGMMRWSTFSSSSGTIDADGNLWVGGGRNGDAVRGDIYKFSVAGGPVCEADFNNDDLVNSQDFFDFLTAFFATAPNADFNGDMVINSQDFFDFLTAFFAGC